MAGLALLVLAGCGSAPAAAPTSERASAQTTMESESPGEVGGRPGARVDAQKYAQRIDRAIRSAKSVRIKTSGSLIGVSVTDQRLVPGRLDSETRAGPVTARVIDDRVYIKDESRSPGWMEVRPGSTHPMAQIFARVGADPPTTPQRLFHHGSTTYVGSTGSGKAKLRRFRTTVPMSVALSETGSLLEEPTEGGPVEGETVVHDTWVDRAFRPTRIVAVRPRIPEWADQGFGRKMRTETTFTRWGCR